jgi:hypothetical protein
VDRYVRSLGRFRFAGETPRSLLGTYKENIHTELIPIFISKEINLLFLCTKDKVSGTNSKSFKKYVALYRDLHVKLFTVMMYAFTIFKLWYHVMCLYVNQVYVSDVRKQSTQ